MSEVHNLLWRIMRATSADAQGFTHRLLKDISGADAQIIRHYVGFLSDEGVLREESGRYCVRRDGVIAPPYARASSRLKGRQQQAIWICLRTMKALPISEIVLMTALDEAQASATIIRLYLQALVAVGYARCEGERGALTRLLAAHNTGPRAPIPTSTGIYDINVMRAVNVTDHQQGRAA